MHLHCLSNRSCPTTCPLLVHPSLLQYGADPEAYDILNATRFGRLTKLKLLLAAAAAAAEGGQALELGDAATLLQRAVAWDRADCLEVGGGTAVART